MQRFVYSAKDSKEVIAGTAKRGTLCPHRDAKRPRLAPLVAAFRRPARRAALLLAAWRRHVEVSKRGAVCAKEKARPTTRDERISASSNSC